jgi:hypothetical protein
VRPPALTVTVTDSLGEPVVSKCRVHDPLASAASLPGTGKIFWPLPCVVAVIAAPAGNPVNVHVVDAPAVTDAGEQIALAATGACVVRVVAAGARVGCGIGVAGAAVATGVGA